MQLRPLIKGLLVSLILCNSTQVLAQTAAEITQHIEAARLAAGNDHGYLFGQLCRVPIEAVNAPPAVYDVPAALPSTDPERDWYAEPVQVFDDLFFLGQTGFSVWGLRTSEGIILVDAIFEYSVEAEVIDGLRKLGINPDEIRYVIISHGHGDHSGGAGLLQKHGARVVMSEADWDLYRDTAREEVVATRDIVATDGMEITLGDSTVRVYLTPGHTHGTISTVLPVHDNGKLHMAAVWGGTLFNFRGSTPEDTFDRRLEVYADSARRFQQITRDAGVEIMLSNHTAYDGSTVKIPMLPMRKASDPHPYVIGEESVQRFMKVAEECAVAARIANARLNASTPAEQAFEGLMAALNNTDLDAVLALFDEDVLFWGTSTKTLGAGIGSAREYFSPLSDQVPGGNLAKTLEFKINKMSDSMYLLSGTWQVDLADSDRTPVFRISMAVSRRGDEWKIVQFHNSALPG